jgi:hypothetical protein
VRDDYILVAYRYVFFAYAGCGASRPFGDGDIAAEFVFWVDGDWLGGDAGVGAGVASALLGGGAAGVLSVFGVAVGILVWRFISGCYLGGPAENAVRAIARMPTLTTIKPSRRWGTRFLFGFVVIQA